MDDSYTIQKTDDSYRFYQKKWMIHTLSPKKKMIHTFFIQKNDESYRFYPNKKNDLYTIQKNG